MTAQALGIRSLPLQPWRHLAFSIFFFNTSQEILVFELLILKTTCKIYLSQQLQRSSGGPKSCQAEHHNYWKRPTCKYGNRKSCDSFSWSTWLAASIAVSGPIFRGVRMQKCSSLGPIFRSALTQTFATQARPAQQWARDQQWRRRRRYFILPQFLLISQSNWLICLGK